MAPRPLPLVMKPAPVLVLASLLGGVSGAGTALVRTCAARSTTLRRERESAS